MGRHNRSEEAFFDFIPNKKFSYLIRRVCGHPVNPLWIRPWGQLSFLPRQGGERTVFQKT